MKHSKRPGPKLSPEGWLELFRAGFPEIVELEGTNMKASDAAWDLAHAIDQAHRDNDVVALARCYRFVRWTIHQPVEEELLEILAHGFFDSMLSMSFAKKGCLDHLDWGDHGLLTHYTCEPIFDDVENYARLCEVWQKRWSRNQKLPVPVSAFEG